MGSDRDTRWSVSLRGRLILLICLATLPALLFAFFAARNERDAALARAERDALHLTALASREHVHQIRGARALLAWLAGKLAEEGVQSPILRDDQFLRGLLAGHPQLANIGVLSPSGEILSSAYPVAGHRSFRGNPAYEAALQADGVVAGSYVTSPIFARPTLNHAIAVRDPAGHVMAVLFNGLDLAWLEEVARDAGLAEGLAIHIVDRDGTVLAAGGGTSDGEPAPGPPRMTQVPALSSAARGGVLEVGGERRLVVAAPLAHGPGLHVAVSARYDALIAGANAAFLHTLLVLGLLTAFTVLAVFLAAELGILRGLRSLARAARRIGAGDLGARARVPLVRDELAALVHAFNAMAASLEARHADAAASQQKLRALASRLQVIREEEAARISRSLHDEMGQALTALKFDLARMRGMCAREGDGPCGPAMVESLTEASDRIGDMVGLVRRLAAELRPGVLDRLGLAAALHWLADDLSARTGLAIHVDADEDAPAVAEAAAVALFRVAQEALTNVIRHAEAQNVEVRLEVTGGEATLTVADDGRGIDAERLEGTRSLGLVGMHERVGLLGGHLSVGPRPAGGTLVQACVPSHPSPEDSDAHPAC